jgi:hypothetical protein
MSTPIEIVVQMMSAFDHAELCIVMKAGADLLTKGMKAAPKASRATGVVPPQLAKNKEWVEIAFTNAKENGWPAFEAKDGDSIVVMEPSVETEEGPRFEDGSEITMKQAMSLAKHLKDSGDELWVAFSESYEEEHPKEVKSATASPVRRTRAEISAAAEERKARLEEERAEKARIRAEEKAARDAKKAEEAEAKAAAKAEKEAEKAAAKAAKEAEKASKLPAAASSATASRMAALLAKVKPAAAVTAANISLSPPASPRAAVVAAAAPAAPAKKSMAQMWKAPADGAYKAFPYKGKIYMADNKYRVYTKGAAQGELGDWVGQYILDEDRIDDSVDEPLYD